MKRIDDDTWAKAQTYEKNWWKTCHNTMIEDLKQLSLTKRIGLDLIQADSLWIDCHQKRIIDIGGGVTSLLLKCFNFKQAVVVDPILMPEWVEMRYKAANIEVIHKKAEDIQEEYEYQEPFDEAWIYNCLQHTQDPEKILRGAQHIAKMIRIHEWIDVDGNEGHPQKLTAKELNDILGGFGEVGMLMERFNSGKVYAGKFQSPVFAVGGDKV
jgi:2-polyprenyl-3-methyl-5-hydroxy-6-metoxy-1,4-benzoquinol methylase